MENYGNTKKKLTLEFVKISWKNNVIKSEILE